MSTSGSSNPAVTPSSLQPVATNMPRRVSFGTTPVSVRPVNVRTTTTTYAPDSDKLHRRLLGYFTSKSPANSKQGHCVPTQKVKSISCLDKEEEARMAKLHKAKGTKGGVTGVLGWLEKKMKGEGDKKA